MISEDDTGYFGPGSVAWRIHRDPAYGIGGIASLFVQALHPVAMAAVDQHSDFSYNAWVRTWRTTEWVFTIVFGKHASGGPRSRSGSDAPSAHTRHGPGYRSQLPCR
jgi:uncharacterized protein (DUF2236 family)